MMSLSRSLSGVLFVLLLAPSLNAQEAAPKATTEIAPLRATNKKIVTAKDLDERQLNAAWQLSQLAELATQIEDAQSRIKVQARIADALWTQDEVRARRLFEEAFKNINSIKFTDRSASIRALQDLSARTQLRGEVLRLASTHDSVLVEKLIKSIAEEPLNRQASTSILGKQSERGSLYLQIAAYLAETDPPRAAEMIKTSLSNGLDSKIVGVLQILRQKHQVLADDLFSYAMSMAARDSAHPALHINYLAPYVFPNFGQTSENFFNEAAAGGALQASSASTTQFLNFSFAVIMQQMSTATTADSTQSTLNYSTSQLMLPYFSLYMPDKTAHINAALAQFAVAISPEQVKTLDVFTRPNSVEDLLDKAEKETQREVKDIIFAHAAMKLARTGETAQALSVVDKISGEQMRSDFKSIIRFQAATDAISKFEIEKAYLHAKELSNLPMRAYVLTKIAQALMEKKETPRAFEMLEEAQLVIGKADDGLDKANAALIITSAMARLDAPRGFEFMSATIKTINNSEVDLRYPSSNTTKAAGAPNITAMMNVGLGVNTLDFDKGFSLLAQADYQQALYLAKALSKKDAAVLAQLAVCRAVLAQPRREAAPPAKEGDKREPSAAPRNSTEKKPAPPSQPQRRVEGERTENR